VAGVLRPGRPMSIYPGCVHLVTRRCVERRFCHPVEDGRRSKARWRASHHEQPHGDDRRHSGAQGVEDEEHHVEVRSDRQHLVNRCCRRIRAGRTRGWRRKGSAPTRSTSYTFMAGIAGNEYVDRLANRALGLLSGRGDPAPERRHGRGESPVRVKVQAAAAEARAEA